MARNELREKGEGTADTIGLEQNLSHRIVLLQRLITLTKKGMLILFLLHVKGHFTKVLIKKSI